MDTAGFAIPLKGDLASTYGTYLIGTFMSAILLGLTINQTYRYFTKYSDGFIIKITVTLLLVLEILHSAFSFHVVYHYLIINFENPFALLESVWSLNLNFTIICVNALCVRVFYSTWIYNFNGKKHLLPVVLATFALVPACLGGYLTAVLFEVKDRLLLELPGRLDTLAKWILATSAGIDLCIAASLSFFLHKSRTGFRKTDKLINKLVIYIVNNGILTSTVDILALIFVFAQPGGLAFLAITQVIGNLYTNSLIALLNSRRSIKESAMNVGNNTGGAGSTNIEFNTLPHDTERTPRGYEDPTKGPIGSPRCGESKYYLVRPHPVLDIKCQGHTKGTTSESTLNSMTNRQTRLVPKAHSSMSGSWDPRRDIVDIY